MIDFCFINDPFYSFIFAIMLFVFFTPGVVFTIPPSYRDKHDFLAKFMVSVIHGLIFMFVFIKMLKK